MGCNEKHLRRPTARLKPRARKLVASAQDCKLLAPKLEFGSLRLMLSCYVMYASGAILDRFSLTQRDLVGAVGVSRVPVLPTQGEDGRSSSEDPLGVKIH